MTRWQHYHIAVSIPDALQALAAAPGPARIIGGGTDLLLDIEQGRMQPLHTLVDVTRIPEMTAIARRGESLFVGAGAALSRIVASPLVAAHAAALHTAADLIGGPQVRNTATLGGNVAHALPAGDGAIALIALDARAEIASAGDGRRLLPLPDLYLGPGRSALIPGQEVLVGFHLPLAGPGEGSAFARVMRPQGVAIAILNCAVWLRRQDDKIVAARVAVGPSGPTPRRLSGVEEALAGRPLDDAVFADALAALLAAARFRTSPHRATADYRRHIIAHLLHETLHTAWQKTENV